MWRILPGPVWFALWCATAVSAPLIWFVLTEPAEMIISKSPPVLWWAVCATLVLAVVTAARWRVRYAVVGTGAGFMTAVAAGLAVALAYLCLTLAVYRWIIPLQEPPSTAVLGGLPLAAVAAAIGFALGRRSSRSSRSSWPALMAAVAVAVLGALIAPLTVQRGAELSFDTFPPGGTSSLAGGPEEVTLPTAGGWGIYVIGSAPVDPDCLVAAVGKTGEPADRIPIPPVRPGADTVPTYRWVAQFDVSAPGAYSVTCQPRATYIVNRPPTIRGAVGALVHWPVPTIWLLGALPGVLVAADILIRRTRRGRSDRAEPGVDASTAG